MTSDQDLLQRIAAGDRSAFMTFYERYAPRVWGLISRILCRREDAEDALQMTFWQVWRSAGKYDSARACPEVWLLLLARSRALDQLRRQTPVASLREEELSGGDYPGSELERGEIAQRVRDALGQLPGEQSSAIRLAFFGGLTHEQIAERQATPLGTVKTHIRRGMQRLRELLREAKEVTAS
jgi:RNA polymerase sigma-70 factor (ECF subfamily)